MDKASGRGVGQKRQSKKKKCDMGMSRRSKKESKGACKKKKRMKLKEKKLI